MMHSFTVMPEPRDPGYGATVLAAVLAGVFGSWAFTPRNSMPEGEAETQPG